MVHQHVETFARELLQAGWQPTSECCRVVLTDGQTPRLVDSEVWKTMVALYEAQRATEGDAGASASDLVRKNAG
jgi:hypothetical protein